MDADGGSGAGRWSSGAGPAHALGLAASRPGSRVRGCPSCLRADADRETEGRDGSFIRAWRCVNDVMLPASDVVRWGGAPVTGGATCLIDISPEVASGEIQTLQPPLARSCASGRGTASDPPLTLWRIKLRALRRHRPGIDRCMIAELWDGPSRCLCRREATVDATRSFSVTLQAWMSFPCHHE